MSPTANAERREVRSFVRREGRMTAAQARALEKFWPAFGVDVPDKPLDLAAVFGRKAPVVLEIGFGNGDNLLLRAQNESEHDFLGVEVHRPGVGRLLQRCAAAGLKNVRIARADAVDVVRDWVPEASLAEVQILFPDPWPKKRHHKRRLIQPAFVSLLVRRLRDGGRLRLATDWKPYADHMLQVLDAEPGLRSVAGAGRFMQRPNRLATRFELRGSRLGHEVFDLEYLRVAA